MRATRGLLSSAVALATVLSTPVALAADETGPTVSVLVSAPETPKTLSSTDEHLRWERVEVPLINDIETTLDHARGLYGREAVVELVYQLLVPADEPLFDQQWYLQNTGQTQMGIADADIDAAAAWKVALGGGVRVAVVDSGVDVSHDDLVGQVTQGWDFVDGDSNPSPVGSGPDEAHGTMVAGVIAAADNDVGIAGVAPGAGILNMRACESGQCRSGDVANSIYYAVDAGADIVNLSLGSPGTGDFPIASAIDYARAHGVLVVAAAGNGGQDMDNLPGGEIMIPAGLPHENILAVGASTDRDRIAEFSNYGESLDLFAPGQEILTTAGVGLPQYVYIDGTSFAAPIVSGVAALLLSHDPGIEHAELIARITAFTDKPGALNGLGASGRVNAAKTLNNRFVDTSSSVFHETAKWLAEQNVTEGCNPPQNHRFCPGDNVTRGQMAVFFARGFDLPNTGRDFFDDDDGLFYEAAANKMAAAGITVGCGPDSYCGERDISRGEMAAMLARVLGLPSPTTDHFTDDQGSTFESAINRVADAGITQGCNPPANTAFCPDEDVNRGQMAAFLQRSMTLDD